MVEKDFKVGIEIGAKTEGADQAKGALEGVGDAATTAAGKAGKAGEKITETLGEVTDKAGKAGVALDQVTGGGGGSAGGGSGGGGGASSGGSKGAAAGGGSSGGLDADRIKELSQLLTTITALGTAAASAAGQMRDMGNEVDAMAGQQEAHIDMVKEGMGVLMATMQGFATGGPWGALAGAAIGVTETIMHHAQAEIENAQRETEAAKAKLVEIHALVKKYGTDAFKQYSDGIEASIKEENDLLDAAEARLKRHINSWLTAMELKADTEEAMDKVRLAKIKASDLSEGEKVRAAAALEIESIARKSEAQARTDAARLKEADDAVNTAEQRQARAAERLVAAQKKLADVQEAYDELQKLRAAGKGNSSRAISLEDDAEQLHQAEAEVKRANSNLANIAKKFSRAVEILNETAASIDQEMEARNTKSAIEMAQTVNEGKKSFNKTVEDSINTWLSDELERTKGATDAAGKLKAASSQWIDALGRIQKALEDGLQPEDYEPIRAALMGMKESLEGRQASETEQITAMMESLKSWNDITKQSAADWVKYGKDQVQFSKDQTRDFQAMKAQLDSSNRNQAESQKAVTEALAIQDRNFQEFQRKIEQRFLDLNR